MQVNRRDAVQLGAAAALGSIFAMSRPALAGKAGTDSYNLGGADVAIHPVNHASLLMSLPGLVTCFDPVGPVATYEGLPAPDLILITHQHGDHFSPETLSGLVADNTQLITNPAVFALLPEPLKSRAQALANGEQTAVGEIGILALPAYNTTQGRENYHPKGRDNGYLVSFAGGRIYVAGDTEDTPEMRALTAIDIAFLPMNLPYTMDIAQAASAVAAFAPKYVYPYHYKDSDTEAFARLVAESGTATRVVLRDWYS